jgi:hypothetical protein
MRRSGGGAYVLPHGVVGPELTMRRIVVVRLYHRNLISNAYDKNSLTTFSWNLLNRLYFDAALDRLQDNGF